MISAPLTNGASPHQEKPMTTKYQELYQIMVNLLDYSLKGIDTFEALTSTERLIVKNPENFKEIKKFIRLEREKAKPMTTYLREQKLKDSLSKAQELIRVQNEEIKTLQKSLIAIRVILSEYEQLTMFQKQAS